MPTDSALKHLKGKTKPYKVADRNGMYAFVAVKETISFRYDYRVNGRGETLMIGKYDRDGISLAAAREKCLDARRAMREGHSPAQERRREKRRLRASKRHCHVKHFYMHRLNLKSI
ncbi:MAG: Arm DNA-binding domain-containing protein [Rhizobiaceae bacterium]